MKHMTEYACMAQRELTVRNGEHLVAIATVRVLLKNDKNTPSKHLNESLI